MLMMQMLLLIRSYILSEEVGTRSLKTGQVMFRWALIHLIFSHHRQHFSSFIRGVPHDENPYHRRQHPNDVDMSCHSASEHQGLAECPQIRSVSRHKRQQRWVVEGIRPIQALSPVVLVDVYASIEIRVDETPRVWTCGWSDKGRNNT